MEAGQLALLLEVELEPRLRILQVTKFYSGHGCLKNGPETPKEMRCQGIPISFHQQICFQFPLLLLGDGLTFLYFCQVVANKMELLSLSGVVCRLCFVERPLLVSIIVNSLTKMVPNIKDPVVVTAVLEVHQHEAVSAFRL